MIEYATGSIFDSGAQALVNPVNCRGVTGRGLALEFKQRFPKDVGLYFLHCELRLMMLGGVYFTQAEKDGPKIIHFPTKEHWRSSSRLEDIRHGLISLIHVVNRLDIQSIAIPALGCGCGGLKWFDVKPLIENAAREMPDVRVLIFEPH